MRQVDPLLLDLSFLTRLDFCILYFLAGLAGIGYGIKKKSRLTVLVAVAVSIIFGLMILASIILVYGEITKVILCVANNLRRLYRREFWLEQ
ncbi:hypothetical protein [Sporomusa malonica]|uniref:Uncharacterized protein n=1 Tax=Sporomusa malonica TaxID=112901 RepID=A0A1W1ZL47_9FIRM|nr:hypothetical protein [Sporomusa malonica]SMC48771.1 hypothetical protein SAMN04488500_1044 [Sporomusa malonica]